MSDAFVVRYDADAATGPGRRELPPHVDESVLSATVMLNDQAEYEGGGVWFAATGDAINADAGSVVAFAGGLRHGGLPVTRGTRYIVALFMYSDANAVFGAVGDEAEAPLLQVLGRQRDVGPRARLHARRARARARRRAASVARA